MFSSETYSRFIKTLEKYDLQTVSEVSGVSASTMEAWIRFYRAGKPSLPQVRTLVAVAEAIGFTVSLTLKRSRS